ncbi:hypothetical protein CKAN_00074700 [Cinnamomum micranthum f. kanehirae]|uniref:Uncharacterized protein n=1 Tax=Cinnamomum micranthum f. kanehirae TaxID=337451 RepID=A0A3S3PS46_9MAGN|nr:hypothetical protein CKAN_00074700 [Cinnamomum micranthum f. kanehirae]
MKGGCTAYKRRTATFLLLLRSEEEGKELWLRAGRRPRESDRTGVSISRRSASGVDGDEAELRPGRTGTVQQNGCMKREKTKTKKKKKRWISAHDFMGS